MQAGNLFSDFINLFYPHYCFGCRQSMVKGEEILCSHCIFDLPKTNYHKNGSSLLKEKLEGRLTLDYAFAYLKFKKSGIVQHLLHELKYNNHPEVGVKLGKLYGRELAENGVNDFDLIVPVPLHESRRRKRGYNQSAKFAEGLSSSLGISWDESISMRTSSTATQTRKTKAERWTNVKDVFAVRNSDHVKGKRILLVDDVITTGATLEACGQHLIDQGCKLSIACIAEAQ
jgi:ComF family protein